MPYHIGVTKGAEKHGDEPRLSAVVHLTIDRKIVAPADHV
jgi:hypothetical protein